MTEIDPHVADAIAINAVTQSSNPPPRLTKRQKLPRAARRKDLLAAWLFMLLGAATLAIGYEAGMIAITTGFIMLLVCRVTRQ